MAEVIEHLDREFEEYLYKFKTFMSSYNVREEYIATNWITKLQNSHESIEERRLRNRFIKHFVKNHEAGVNVFQIAPYKSIPVEFFGPLIGCAKYLPKDSKGGMNSSEDEKRAYISDLFSGLSDKGLFLGKLPVPREGSFFIIVLKPNESVICENE